MFRRRIHKKIEIGQYFMTKDVEAFSRFDDPVACREYTSPRDDEPSKPRGWIRGSTKIGPVLELSNQSHHQGKHGFEIKIESSSKDESHSWIRISNGLNKFVRDVTEKARIFENNEDTLTSTENSVAWISSQTQNSQIDTGKPVAKARPRQASTPSSSSTSTTFRFVREKGLT